MGSALDSVVAELKAHLVPEKPARNYSELSCRPFRQLA